MGKARSQPYLHHRTSQKTEKPTASVPVEMRLKGLLNLGRLVEICLRRAQIPRAPNHNWVIILSLPWQILEVYPGEGNEALWTQKHQAQLRQLMKLSYNENRMAKLWKCAETPSPDISLCFQKASDQAFTSWAEH